MNTETPTAVLLNPQVVVEPGDYRALYDEHSSVRDAFDDASGVLGFDLAGAFLDDDPALINSGTVVRPASLAIATAIYGMTVARGRPPTYLAGLSLGAIVAGHLSGHMSFRDAVRMTHLMPAIEDRVFAGKGLGVAFYYGVDIAAFEDAMRREVAAGRVLSPCAYTAADQMILTGELGALRAMNVRAVACGGVGVVIPHGPPAHSPLPVLHEVEERFRGEWRYRDPAGDPDIPVICNLTSRVLATGDELTDSFIRQYSRTVHWERGVRRLAELGVRKVTVIGPGHFVLKSLRSTPAEFEVEAFLGAGDLPDPAVGRARS
ncbi:[acyl-carrier-protein] S-malonyltransferase [Murinocardiopsis flavida]|uniref:[acyl-carrier-protein] S-malonyltransferase n=1 Tax=Murinocardiopsis flavida TaxID=645275 RepID=A0A2P8D559_9ACTN|nr:ACP S-malonyltransferase [Murinocardiopsis flavida]PSK92351.1 [acyl-carrier-protein] S-malonyltransferase [Murinocardiopsis flavida]